MPSDVLSQDITKMDAERHTGQQVLRHTAKREQLKSHQQQALELEVWDFCYFKKQSKKIKLQSCLFILAELALWPNKETCGNQRNFILKTIFRILLWQYILSS